MTDSVVFWDRFEAKTIVARFWWLGSKIIPLPGPMFNHFCHWDCERNLAVILDKNMSNLFNIWLISVNMKRTTWPKGRCELVHNSSVRAFLIHMHIVYQTPTVFFLSGSSITGPLAVPCVLQGVQGGATVIRLPAWEVLYHFGRWWGWWLYYHYIIINYYHY